MIDMITAARRCLQKCRRSILSHSFEFVLKLKQSAVYCSLRHIYE